MLFLREKYVKHIYVTVFIFIQIIAIGEVAGFSCVQCGENGTKCKDDLSDVSKTCTGDSKRCFTKIDTSGNIIRGCRKSEEESTCKSEEGCVLTDEGKNNQLICKTCAGTDDNCSQTDASETKYNKICDSGISKCFKKINEKLVVRGCAGDTEISQCTDKKNCETCESNNCNTGIFPADRIRCYQCSGEKCNDVTAGNVVPKACLNYIEGDECYTKGESATSMIRGCKSDAKENKCSAIGEGCAFCNVSNCNNLKYRREQELKCYQCTGDAKNGDCFKDQTESNQTLKSCEKTILYNQIAQCFTQFEGDKIVRGCLHDSANLTVEKCKDGEGEVCHICNNGNGCNGKMGEFTCIVCRSDIEKKCWNEASQLTGQKCRTGKSSPAQGCFQGIWKQVVIRGCMIDASAQNQELCKDENNKNQCSICNQKDCNTKTTSGVKKNNLSLALMLIVLINLWSLK